MQARTEVIEPWFWIDGDGRGDLLYLGVEVVDVGEDLAGRRRVMLFEAAVQRLVTQLPARDDRLRIPAVRGINAT